MLSVTFHFEEIIVSFLFNFTNLKSDAHKYTQFENFYRINIEKHSI